MWCFGFCCLKPATLKKAQSKELLGALKLKVSFLERASESSMFGENNQ